MNLRLLLLVAVLAVTGGLGLAGCTSTVSGGMPVPELTFDHMAPFPVQVADIDVENHYDPSDDPQDVSSSFPTPPDIALRRYAESRFQPVGDSGTLKFIIEDSHIHHSLVQPASKFTGWLGLDRKDLYEVVMRLRMFKVTDEGKERDNVVLNLKRSISIPQRHSVAQKDMEKFRFLEMLMQDVDDAVTSALRDKIKVAAPSSSVPPAPAAPLTAPEAR